MRPCRLSTPDGLAQSCPLADLDEATEIIVDLTNQARSTADGLDSMAISARRSDRLPDAPSVGSSRSTTRQVGASQRRWVAAMTDRFFNDRLARRPAHRTSSATPMSAAAAITPYVSAGQFLDAIYQGVEEGWAHTFRPTEPPVNGTSTGRRSDSTTDSHLTRRDTRHVVHLVRAGRSIQQPWPAPGRTRRLHADHRPWLDVDVAGPQHAVENLPPTRAAAYQLIGDYPMPPSAIVDTGNGLQAWWFLAEPLSATEAESP